MMKIINTLLISLLSVTGFAQKSFVIEPSLLEVQYCFTEQYDTLKMDKPHKDRMLLRIGKDCSQFLNLQRYYSDSLINDPNGEKVWGQMMLKAIQSRQYSAMPIAKTSLHSYLYKNYPTGKLTVADQLAGTYFAQYEEAWVPQAWTMLDSTKQILGYTCQKAECNFRGRQYIAWFTTDIPVSDGPWKLNGLPGLIMKAYDSRHYFEFLAEGIRRHGTRPVTFYKFYDYQKITREKARKYIINRDAISAAESASLGLSGGNHEKANPNKADDIEKE